MPVFSRMRCNRCWAFCLDSRLRGGRMPACMLGGRSFPSMRIWMTLLGCSGS